MLNRILTWGDKGVGYEADPRHAEITIRDLGFSVAKAVTTPGTKEEGRTKSEHKQDVDAAHTASYRSLVARLNDLAADVDIAFSVEELANTMSKPTKGSWEQLGRIGRYLLYKPRLVTMFG